MNSFLKNLTDIKFANEKERKEEIWDVEGRLKNGNKLSKFDIRPLVITPTRGEKIGFFNTKADKIVFETEEKWIVFDAEELIAYVKKSSKRDFNVNELLYALTWNLQIDK
jgi:hypothetical protein